MFSTQKQSNEEGFALVTTLVIMVILILLGTFAINNTSTEIKIAGNDRAVKEDFFNQEACVSDGVLQYKTWLTNSYLISDPNTVSYPANNSVDSNGNGVHDASECSNGGKVVGAFKIRNITQTPAMVTWGDAASFGGTPSTHPANMFPKMAHKDKVPTADENTDSPHISGSSKFEIRRYVVTSYAPAGDRNAVIQQGFYRQFPKP